MTEGVVDFKVAIPNGTQIAAQFLGLTPRLEASMMKAMDDIITKLHQDSVSFMQWKNPTGNLESTEYEIITAWKGTMGYAAPYSLRRDKGFTGMTDSLGRFYNYDPGKFYLENAFIDNNAYINERIGTALKSVLP